jgi:UDP-N-acetylglucosamine 2-epimerase (non-hydrolysing)
MKKVLICFGTRPEAIKMCPLVKELRSRKGIKTVTCVTGQHRQMLDQILQVFDIVPEYDLNIMKRKQSLFDITNDVLHSIKSVLEQEKPDIVLVHGDTSSAFITSLACYYMQIPVGHVEAGLRTYNIYSPYPEEFNRQGIGIIAKYHFAPTEMARENLIAEQKREDTIFVTGNTVIDALKNTVCDDYVHPYIEWVKDSRLVLLTAHRRENIGKPLENIFMAVKKIVHEFDDVKVIYPIHLNPKVRSIADKVLAGIDRVKLIEPLDVLDFHNFMARSFLVLTDSGGIQEEAPALGKPVLVLRNTTERPEGVDVGTLKLVGTDKDNIYRAFKLLLTDKEEYKRIADILEGVYKNK